MSQSATDERGKAFFVARAAGFYLVWSDAQGYVSIYERVAGADPDPLPEVEKPPQDQAC